MVSVDVKHYVYLLRIDRFLDFDVDWLTRVRFLDLDVDWLIMRVRWLYFDVDWPVMLDG